MEAKQYVRIITFLALVFSPALVFGYSDEKTHPLLTREAIKVFEASEGKSFTEGEKQKIIQGVQDEDSAPRWLNHFYDPVNKRGLNKGQFASSKQWANGESSVTNHYAWDNAIYEYVYGSKEKGLMMLGRTMHLTQDKFVPAHTRDDAHPLGETYESYAKDKTSVPSSNLVSLSSLEAYFDVSANFSNSNFFSDDTILKDYDGPKINKLISEKNKDGVNNLYGHGDYGRLIWVNKWWDDNGNIQNEYSLKDTDNKIMSDYWSVLAPQAVGYSAGVIKLFLAEALEEQKSGALKEERTPWWERLVADAKTRIDQTLASLSLLNQISLDPTLTPPARPEAPPVDTPVVPIVPIITPPNPITDEIDPRDIARLEAKLRQLRIQLDALAEAQEAEVLPVIHVVNQVLSSAGASPVIIDDDLVEIIIATTTATSTATSTDEADLPVETPAVNLEIESCANSLSNTTCLLVSTSTLIFSWLPTPAEEYLYDLIKLTQSFDEEDQEIWTRQVASSTAETTLTIETDFDLDDYPLEFRWQVEMKLASTSEVVASSSILSTFFHPRPLVINEIAWSGMSSTTLDTDEWLELRNFAEQDIALDNYYLTDIDNTWRINLSGLISAEGYYLIERGSDEVVSNRVADLIEAWGSDPLVKSFDLSRIGIKLYQTVSGGDQLIDETPLWDKTSSLFGTLERNWESEISSELSTWEDNQECYPSDGPCALDREGNETFGTPGVINRASIPRLW